MSRLARLVALAVAAVGMLAFPAIAAAGHDERPAYGQPASAGTHHRAGGARRIRRRKPDIHTDIAFQGKYAYQGNWDGFNIRDIRSPNNPRQVSRTFCDGNQGDIVVYKDILVRAWNTPAGTTGPFGAGFTCDGQAVPAGFEGVHVFDISDKSEPGAGGGYRAERSAPGRHVRLRVTHADARAGPQERPRDHLQPDLGRAVPIRLRSSRSRLTLPRTPAACGTSRSKRRMPATTPE